MRMYLKTPFESISTSAMSARGIVARRPEKRMSHSIVCFKKRTWEPDEASDEYLRSESSNFLKNIFFFWIRRVVYLSEKFCQMIVKNKIDYCIFLPWFKGTCTKMVSGSTTKIRKCDFIFKRYLFSWCLEFPSIQIPYKTYSSHFYYFSLGSLRLAPLKGAFLVLARLPLSLQLFIFLDNFTVTSPNELRMWIIDSSIQIIQKWLCSHPMLSTTVCRM